MLQLRLRQADAHLLYLGLLHAEAQPGRGLAARPGERRREQPLAPLRALLEGGLDRAVVELDVPDGTLPLLGEALAGAINELKQMAMADGRSMVPGFAETARRFYPQLADEPAAALDVVGHGVMLRRRLDAAASAPEAPPGGAGEPRPGRWSRLWRR